MSRTAWPALLASAVLLSGCASTVGGLPVQWRTDGPPVVTAPSGDCPTLDGAYDSTGQAQGDETKAALLPRVPVQLPVLSLAVVEPKASSKAKWA